MALFAYRRQEFLRDVCQLVGYSRRNLWVVRSEDVALIGARWSGPSRISYFLVGLEPLELLPFTEEEGKLVALDSNTAMIALPRIRGRRLTMILFVHPEVYDKYQWSSRKAPQLRLEELNALRGIKGINPATEHMGQVLCIHRGLMDRKFERTERGTALLLAHGGKDKVPARKHV